MGNGNCTVAAALAGFAALAGGCSDTNTLSDVTPEGPVTIDELAVMETGVGLAFAATDVFDAPIVLASGTSTPTSVNDAAARAAAAFNQQYTPPSCGTATASGAVVTYQATNCGGPLALATIKGTYTVTYGSANGQLTLQLHGTGLRVNGDVFELSASGSFQVSGATKTLELTSTSTRNGSTTRQRTDTVKWVNGSTCVTINGTGSTTADGVTYATTLRGYQRCRGACPSAGTLQLAGPDRTTTATFDGTDKPSISTGTGSFGTIQLTCG